ncbi:hypothetical protein MNBD_GAMMA12-2734 [hydrothermal vent metagenome]|uniref:Uncharacterized protein n=1 Tax=hydrothermal vent metagenome TaxID=652676 RepID=A0A3B0Z041_9ZZZZ
MSIQQKLNMSAHKFAATLLVISVILSLSTGFKLIFHSNWITGPNYIHWKFGDGSELPDKIKASNLKRKYWGCGRVLGSKPLRSGNIVWTACGLSGIDEVSIARIDAKTRTGILWPFPDTLKLRRLLGYALSANGDLVLAYLDGSSRLLFGIVNKNGWVVSPVLLPNTDRSSFIALSWVNNRAELLYMNRERYTVGIVKSKKGPNLKKIDRHTQSAVGRSTVVARPIIIASVNHKKLQLRKLPLADAACQVEFKGKKTWACKTCNVVYKKNEWHTIVKINTNTQPNQYVEVTGSGKIIPSAQQHCWRNASRMLNASVFGVIQAAYSSAQDKNSMKTMTLDGKLVNDPRPARKHWKPVYTNSWLETAKSTLELRHKPLWITGNADKEHGEYSRLARAYRDGWLVTDYWKGKLRLQILNTKGVITQSNVVAKLGNCRELHSQGIHITRPDGGFWLLSPYGCQINLSKDLQRLDPYSISDHLRSRGSINLDRNERIHIKVLVWVLFGLPVSLIVFLGLAYYRQKTSIAVIINASTFHIITSGIIMIELWPLLQ